MHTKESSQTKSDNFNTIVGYIVFVIVAYLILSAAKSMDSQYLAAAFTAGGSILAAVITISHTKSKELQAQALRDIRERKTPIYEEFVRFLSKVQHGEKLGKKVTEKEMVDFFISINERMIVWGSDEILKAWIDWKRCITNQKTDEDAKQMIFLYEEMLYKIRIDLGHKNKNLSRGDILSLSVNDIANYL